MALRQAIFDSLDEVRYTGDGNMGRQSRVSVKIQFSKDKFDKKFRKQGNENIPDNDCGNVECYITGEELTKATGEGWNTRNYKTSTETFVSFKENIHLSWGYKPRFQYDHSACQRCTWIGLELERPETRTPSQSMVKGPPWIQLKFTRGRRNRVTGSISHIVNDVASHVFCCDESFDVVYESIKSN